MRAAIASAWFKPAVFITALLPMVWLLVQVYLASTGGAHELTSDPGKVIVQFNGEWALIMFLCSLAVTPVRKLSGIAEFARIRRMLGLFAFFYAAAHLGTYLVFLLELRFADLAADILKRPYITVGFAAFLMLVPLAITSNKAMIKRLGRRWRSLHKLVYPIGMLAAVHVIWIAKSSYFEAFMYTAVLTLLLLYRVVDAVKIRVAHRPAVSQ